MVGEEGIIQHTKDGGANWEKQTSPVAVQRLVKVQFINQQEGWAIGMAGVVLHTSNGGAHWERLPYKEDVNLNDLCFLNASEGWITGEYETILHTADGGKTWKKQRGGQPGQDSKLFGIDFRDSRDGVVVGTEGKTLLTENGGGTWKETKNGTGDTLLKVKYLGTSNILAIGLRGAVVQTKDGSAFLVGDLGAIWRSKDQGKNWMRLGMFF